MAMTICSTCGQENPADNRYCGSCGAKLNERALIISQPSPIMIGDRQLSQSQIKALAATIAVGLAALLAEAGLAYLQNLLSSRERPSLSLRRKKKSAVQETTVVPVRRRNGRVVTVVSERVIVEKRWGRPVRRVVERFAWRGEERDS